MTATIRGVLFDSGGVLVRPVAASAAPETRRRWFPGPRFEEIVEAYLPNLSLAGLEGALQPGMQYLEERHRRPVLTLGEEQDLFQDFYRFVLQALGVADPPAGLTEDLARERVAEVHMEPFREVAGVLERLRARGLLLGVLSESWPSLEWNYERLGLRRFFGAFTISAKEALLKSDPNLFAVARERMHLPAPEILFVDNWPPYVKTAVRLGFQGAVLDRDGDSPPLAGMTYVADLLGIERMVADVGEGG
ncbi:MAG: HAD family hydrolase [Acidimicrobiia bacterium]